MRTTSENWPLVPHESMAGSMIIQGKKRLRSLGEEITDLPNVITLIRVATLPLVLALIDNHSRLLSFLSAALFALAALTDILDGYLARRRGQVSVLGQFLDPLADKLFVLGVLVFLTARGRVPEWLVILLMSRELAMMALRSLATTYGLVIPAGPGGKAKTALQTVGLIFLLVHFPYELPLVHTTLHFQTVGIALLFLSLFMSFWSFGSYLHFFVQAAAVSHKK